MSDGVTLESLIEAADLFAGLDRADRAAVASALREVRYEAGRTLFLTGDPGTSLLLVAEGRIRLQRTTAAGRELSVRITGPGEVLGEIAALDGGPRSADAVAITAVRAHVLANADLDRLMGERPGFARAVVLFLCGRLRATTEQLEGIALHSIETRLARFLLEALGDTEGEGGKRPALDLGYSQSELARLIGSSRPKTNLALGALEAAGAIRRTADRIYCDRAALGRIAGLDDG